MEKLFTNDEAAEMLRISPHTLRAWLYQGRVRPVRLGSRVLYSEGEIRRLVDCGTESVEDTDR